ncbi:unnamed protein product [Camellia sinensis]
MEKYFGNAYRGDPGVPHADPDRFVNIWIGSFAFSALTWVNPYMWQLSNQFNLKYESVLLLISLLMINGYGHIHVALLHRQSVMGNNSLNLRQTFMPTKKDEASPLLDLASALPLWMNGSYSTDVLMLNDEAALVTLTEIAYATVVPYAAAQAAAQSVAFVPCAAGQAVAHWHDKAMLFEQYHWKKAMAKKQPYKFKWNQYMDKEIQMVGRWYAFMMRFDGCYMSCPLFQSIDLDTLMCRANEQDDVSFLSEAKIDFPGLFSSKFLCNSSGEYSSGSCLSFSFFCNSSDEEGAARVPFCSNLYSFLVFYSKLKNAGSLGPNSRTNLFGYSLLNAKTAKCPFTLSGTVNVATLVFVQNHLIFAFYIAEV